MEKVQVLLHWLFISIVFYAGQLFFTLRWNMHDPHYFLGYNPRLFDVRVFGVKLSVGIYLPLAGLFRIYRVEQGEKVRVHHTWEFFDHPFWKRFFVTIGSILSLTLASMLIFMVLAYQQEDKYIAKEEINKLGIYPSPRAEEAGFVRGDKILLINDKDFESYNDLYNIALFDKQQNHITLLRNGKQIDLVLEKDQAEDLVMFQPPYISLLVPLEIQEVIQNSVAERAGLRVGDIITKVNDTPIVKTYEFNEALWRNANEQVTIEVSRKTGDETKVIRAQLMVNENGEVDILTNERITYTVKTNSLPEAMVQGVVRPFITLKKQINAFFKIMFGSIGYQKNVGGPISMTKAYGHNYRWLRFWAITATVCIVTAFMNLLPLPRAIFWKLLPLAYERLTRRKYSYVMYQRTRTISIVVVILLMMWIFYNDVSKLF